MSATDSPDWQNVVIINSGGGVTDAPDWQEVIVGPGGGPVPGGAIGTSTIQPFINSGFLGVTMDPYIATGGAGLLGGTSYIMPFAAGFTGTVNNVILPVKTGASMTPTTTFAGIYDWGETTAGTMTLLCSSASGAAATAWASGGVTPVAMTTHPTLTSGKTYAVLIQCNGGGPSTEGVTFPGVVTGGLTQYPRGATVGAGGTSLPATITFLSASIALRLPLVYID